MCHCSADSWEMCSANNPLRTHTNPSTPTHTHTALIHGGGIWRMLLRQWEDNTVNRMLTSQTCRNTSTRTVSPLSPPTFTPSLPSQSPKIENMQEKAVCSHCGREGRKCGLNCGDVHTGCCHRTPSTSCCTGGWPPPAGASSKVH